MAQGIYRTENETVPDAEIRNAFHAAQDANKIYPGTVWGLIFFNQFKNEKTGEVTMNNIKKWKAKAVEHNLKIGARVSYCGGFKDITDDHIDLDLKKLVDNIALESDYIMCSLYPGLQYPQQTVSHVVERVGQRYW